MITLGFVMNMSIFSSASALERLSRRTIVDNSLTLAQSTISVFTRFYPDTALMAATRADVMKSAGVALSPINGLPVSVKDLIDIAGETTLAGSTVLANAATAATDAPVVTRLRAAGAAIIGKTNMTEFAYSGVGLNPHYGTAANPADKKVARIPGGSSSGAAVSVAAGICFAAVGSDTGGSIRIPAALCGIVGFKSTARRVPTTGCVPLSTTLDTICAMTHSVDDCILMDTVLADRPLLIPALPLKGLRLALPQTLVLDALDATVAAAFGATLSRLSAAGASIIEAPFSLLAECHPINQFPAAEAYAWHRHLLAQHETQYDPRVAKRIKLGAQISAADYIDALHRRRDWIARMEATLAPFDAMIMPTVPIVAPPIADLEASEEAFLDANRLLLRNPSIINVLDGCAITLPCHPAGTLPVGITLAGPAMRDGYLMGVARAVELELHSWRKSQSAA